MNNKITKQLITSQPFINSPTSHLQLPISNTSSTSLIGGQNKVKLCSKMHKSMKPKILLTEPKQPKSESNIIQKADNMNKIKVFSNQSMSKSKKLSDSYYYTNSRNSKNSNKNINNQHQTNTSKHKDKEQGLQLKARSHHRIITNKMSKSKIFVSSNGNHKTEKSKMYNDLKNFNATGNTNSLKRLISSMSNSEHHYTKLQTVRTFSPEVEFISEQLSHRRKDKKIMKKQQQIVERMAKILEQYRQLVLKQQKQKDVLVKQNRKLKDKLHILNSQKKYKTVVQYNM